MSVLACAFVSVSSATGISFVGSVFVCASACVVDATGPGVRTCIVYACGSKGAFERTSLCVGSRLWVDVDVDVCAYACVSVAVGLCVCDCVVCASIGVSAYARPDMHAGFEL